MLKCYMKKPKRYVKNMMFITMKMIGMSDYVYVSIDMLKKILSNLEKPDEKSYIELFKIQMGDKEIILKHLKAIRNIFSKAINELEGDKDEY